MALNFPHRFFHRGTRHGIGATQTRKLKIETLERRSMLTTFFVDGAAVEPGDGSPNSPFATIQEGIDAAAEHGGADSVVIRPGNYVEKVQIDDPHALTLRGINGPVVQAPDALDDVISMLSGDVTIQSLTVEGGKNGIVATGDTLTLINVNSQFNEDPDLEDGVEDGNGVVATDLNKVTITGGNYSNNGNEEDQHGIRIDTVVELRLNNVTAQENGQHGLDANRIGTLEVIHGTFDNNLDGDGIHVDRTGSLRVVGGTFSDNDGDGIDVRRTDSTEVAGAQVNRNGNEGLEVDDSGTVKVNGSTFLQNDEEGLDIDDTVEIILIGVRSNGDGFEDPDDPGSGLQIEAQDDNDTQSVLIIGSNFSGNAADGILVVEEEGVVFRIELRAVAVTDNVESGLDIVISGELDARAVTSVDNGGEDNIVTG